MVQTTLERNKSVREINYLARDFNSYKNELIEYTKKYFPNDWQDFNEASGGMALIEMISYLGDNLSFLIDRSVNECFIDRAIEPRNIYSLARNMGYNPKLQTPAIVNVNVSATFNDTTSAASIFKVLKGSRVKTSFTPSVNFEITEDIDFSSASNRETVRDGGLTTYTVTGVSAIAGFSKTFSTTVTNPTPFLRIVLPDSNVSEIVSVKSIDGSEWYKVNALSENTIFYGDENEDSTSNDETPYVLKIKRVPKRFVVETGAGNRVSLVFGSGTSTAEDSEIIPNPEDFSLSPTLRGSPSGFSPSLVDSSNFLNTRTLGLAPNNTTLEIKYRVGGGIDSNVGRFTVNDFSVRNIEFIDPNFNSSNPVLASNVLQTLSVINPEQATGGSESEGIESIKRNAISFFNAQNRAVTLQDYQVRVLSMPNSFGSVYRCSVRKSSKNVNGIDLILCGINSNRNLVNVSDVLKNNVEKYIKQFKSFSDTIQILNPDIVNIGFEFSISPSNTVTPNQALLESILLLRDFFEISQTNFNDSIVIPDIISRLQALSSVRSVNQFKIVNKNVNESSDYSSYIFDINSNTKNGVLKFPQNAIWELKFANKDIVGKIT